LLALNTSSFQKRNSRVKKCATTTDSYAYFAMRDEKEHIFSYYIEKTA